MHCRKTIQLNGVSLPLVRAFEKIQLGSVISFLEHFGHFPRVFPCSVELQWTACVAKISCSACSGKHTINHASQFCWAFWKRAAVAPMQPKRPWKLPKRRTERAPTCVICQSWPFDKPKLPQEVGALDALPCGWPTPNVTCHYAPRPCITHP